MWQYRKQLLFCFLLAILGIYIVTLQSTASNDIDLLVQDAVDGDTTAQMQLGDMHIDGVGVLQDYAKAYAWFRIMALYDDISSADKVAQLQQSMTDDEIFDALKEYNYIYSKITKSDKSQELLQFGQIINCETANSRFQSLLRKDQGNFQDNSTIIDFCQLAEASITIWTEIETIVTQCPNLDESGSEIQFAKESIYWATETKLRTCSN